MDRIQELRDSLPRRELRIFRGAAELRATQEGPARIGMTIPFNCDSEDMGFVERIDPGAFDKTLRESDVVSLWNHDSAWVLGRQSNQTLEIRKTETGLDATVTLNPKMKMAIENFLPMVERGDVIGSSFGFEAVDEDDSWWTPLADGRMRRTLKEVRLYDVSPVCFPAYPDSAAEARAMREERAAMAAAAVGVDLGELRAIIAASENGRVLAKHTPSLRRMIDVLSGMLPAQVVPLDVRRRQLELSERRARKLLGENAGRGTAA